MDIWMVFLIISIIAIIVEIFVPTMFCINFAVAGVITAIIAVFWGTFTANLIIFSILSLLFILLLRPVLLKLTNKAPGADFNTDYLGKIVKTIEPVNATSGAVTIYEERWEARLKDNGEEIPADTDVKIVGNESTILFVERL
ncbi:NfeD family protein [bacterium]|nr:NfeD family protein [bacterium]